MALMTTGTVAMPVTPYCGAAKMAAVAVNIAPIVRWNNHLEIPAKNVSRKLNAMIQIIF